MASTLVLIWLALLLVALALIKAAGDRNEAWDKESVKIQQAAQDAEPLLNADSWE